jgi:putative transposase
MIIPFREDQTMAGKREKPEDIVLKLWQVEVLQGQGKSVSKAVRQIGVTVQTYGRWRKGLAMSAIGPTTMATGGMGRDQLKRLKELETENQRLKRVAADLSLDKMILTEAARGNRRSAKLRS